MRGFLISLMWIPHHPATRPLVNHFPSSIPPSLILHPCSSTVTSWRLPSSASAIVPSPDATPSTTTRVTPRSTPSGFRTVIAYVAVPNRYSTENSGHRHGMHGASVSLFPRSVNPRIASSATRYIQLADPVYQVQPPRPRCPSAV